MPRHSSRRKFIGNMSLGLGAIGVSAHQQYSRKENFLFTPREVKIGTVSVMELSATSPQEMLQKVMLIMEEMMPYQPDIVCLPEIFAYCHVQGLKASIRDLATSSPSEIIEPLTKFAARHHCYIICPTYTKQGESVYISAVLIDRAGKVIGEYQKMRPALSELEMGIRPGGMNPPVFETDFGKIGIQICFDIKYEEGWNVLKEKGAEFIFWPSAYAGGQEISSMAWRHQVFLVTSTQKDTSKICDLSGETIVQTNRWQRNWVCGSVNPEKAFVLTWPTVHDFPLMLKKYGSRIRINTFSEEEWTFMESLDKNLKINEVLKAFKIKPMYDFLKELSLAHHKMR